MKKYVVTLSNKNREELTDKLLIGHVEHLKKLSANGQIVICGPFKTSDSAIQILIGNSIEEIENIVLEDPFIKEKYYKNYQIDELIEANEENNFLLNS